MVCDWIPKLCITVLQVGIFVRPAPGRVLLMVGPLLCDGRLSEGGGHCWPYSHEAEAVGDEWTAQRWYMKTSLHIVSAFTLSGPGCPTPDLHALAGGLWQPQVLIGVEAGLLPQGAADGGWGPRYVVGWGRTCLGVGQGRGGNGIRFGVEIPSGLAQCRATSCV